MMSTARYKLVKEQIEEAIEVCDNFEMDRSCVLNIAKLIALADVTESIQSIQEKLDNIINITTG